MTVNDSYQVHVWIVHGLWQTVKRTIKRYTNFTTLTVKLLGKSVTFRCPLHSLYYQCTNPSIIVRLHDQSPSYYYYIIIITIYKTEMSITFLRKHRWELKLQIWHIGRPW